MMTTSGATPPPLIPMTMPFDLQCNLVLLEVFPSSISTPRQLVMLRTSDASLLFLLPVQWRIKLEGHPSIEVGLKIMWDEREIDTDQRLEWD